MSKNQACDGLCSDRVSAFSFLGRFPTLLDDPYWQYLLTRLSGFLWRKRSIVLKRTLELKPVLEIKV